MPRQLRTSNKKARHDPLHVQLDEDTAHSRFGTVSSKSKKRKSKGKDDVEDDGGSKRIIDPKTSRRIFELAKEQQAELSGSDEDEDDEAGERPCAFTTIRDAAPTFDDDEEEIDSDVDSQQDVEEYAELEIDENDMQALQSYLPRDTEERKTLADIIFSKIEEAEAKGSIPAAVRKTEQSGRRDPADGLNPRLVEAYQKVGEIMAGRSQKLPRILKILPSHAEWARMLSLTRPENWSPISTRAATRIFISNLKPAQARVYLEHILLPAVRRDIEENKKLNIHLYESLAKSMYKPAAFFKGIVFPLAEHGCTLREAAIVSSVMIRVRIPMLHSAAALTRLCNMDYAGPNSLFIRILIDKKHALPYKTVDALVFHFIRLSNTYKASSRAESEKLPVLWHQSFLAFVQRYASDLTPEQKGALLDVARATPHAQISPEIRRELTSSVCRGEARPEQDVEMA